MFRRVSYIAMIAASAPLLFAASVSRAQDGTDTPVDLGTITLTASTSPQALSRTGVSVDVVGAGKLRDAPLSLSNLLADLPGVTLSANGGPGTRTVLRLRGLPAYYTGTRIDGIDVSDPSAPQLEYDFGATTTAGLSRIEVLRGSQSALYGSEAIAGVIDITTWRPESDGVSGALALETGSDATHSGTLSLGARGARGEVALSASRTISDGISAFADGSEKDGFAASFVSLYARYDLSEAVSLGFSGFYRDSFAGFDRSTADSDSTTDGQLRGARVFAQVSTGAVTHELSLSHGKTSRDVYEYGSHTYYDGSRDQISYSGSWRPAGPLSLSWGADRSDEDILVRPGWGSVTEGDSRTSSVFAELLYAPRDDLDLSFALRHDDHSRFGGKLTGRLAATWRPDESWILRAVAATGFRAPSLYELYSIYGDAGFSPEESRSFELGAERRFGEDGFLRVTLFDTRITDRVIYDYTSYDCVSGQTPDPFDPYSPYPGCYEQVSGNSTTRGVELSGEAALAPGWRVFGNYTYTDARATEGGARLRLANAPRHVLNLGVETEVNDRLSAHVSLRHMAGFYSAEAGTYPVALIRMSDVTVVNAGLNWAVNETVSASLRVENLLDKEYQTVDGYGQPGRQIFIGLKTRF